MAETNPVTVLKKGSTKAAEKEKDENFTVVVGKKEIKVHKQVIMDASSAFTAMFESGMKECTENKMFIEEEDFSFEVVDAAVKLCYNCGDLSNLNLEDFLSLYRFSDKYEIKHIMNFVEEYLIKIPSPANVCQLIHFSKVFNASKLYQSSIDFLIKCSKDSTPVSGLDILDNDLLAIIFKSTFRPVVDTDI
uniref:BTB domain-containing protein n=1 Tax=Panagrolaimus superbus TaxID=310955 RepID=A0A914Y4G2_9BILA